MPDKTKFEYIADPSTCRLCGSRDLIGGKMDWDEPLGRAIRCGNCGEEWIDILRVCDTLTGKGEPTRPHVFPLNQVLGLRWIGIIIDGLELEIHGPFVADKLMDAARHLFKSMKIDDGGALPKNIFAIDFQPEGAHLTPIEIPFEELRETGG